MSKMTMQPHHENYAGEKLCTDDIWTANIEAIFREKNPASLDAMPKLLKQYEGNLAYLYEKIVCRAFILDPVKMYDSDGFDEASDLKYMVDKYAHAARLYDQADTADRGSVLQNVTNIAQVTKRRRCKRLSKLREAAMKFELEWGLHPHAVGVENVRLFLSDDDRRRLVVSAACKVVAHWRKQAGDNDGKASTTLRKWANALEQRVGMNPVYYDTTPREPSKKRRRV